VTFLRYSSAVVVTWQPVISTDVAAEVLGSALCRIVVSGFWVLERSPLRDLPNRWAFPGQRFSNASRQSSRSGSFRYFPLCTAPTLYSLLSKLSFSKRSLSNFSFSKLSSPHRYQALARRMSGDTQANMHNCRSNLRRILQLLTAYLVNLYIIVNT